MVDNKEQQQLVEYAEWQKTEDEYGNHYVVYQTTYYNVFYVVELDDDLISKVVSPKEYDLDDPKQLCFGCDMCDWHDEAWFNTKQDGEPELCRHREAVITVLKRRRDFNNIGEGGATTIEDDKWVISFAATDERRPQPPQQQELKA